MCCSLDIQQSNVDKSSTGHLLFCGESGTRCFAWAQNVSSRWTKLQLWKAAGRRDTQAGDICHVQNVTIKATFYNPRLESWRLLGIATSHEGDARALLTRFKHLPHENFTPCQLSTSSRLEGVKYKVATGWTQVAAIVVANSWGISVLLWHWSERSDFQCVVALTFWKVKWNEGSK